MSTGSDAVTRLQLWECNAGALADTGAKQWTNQPLALWGKHSGILRRGALLAAGICSTRGKVMIQHGPVVNSHTVRM